MTILSDDVIIYDVILRFLTKKGYILKYLFLHDQKSLKHVEPPLREPKQFIIRMF